MARRVFLHVGPAKTGTSYLQETWWRNRALLREHGLLYPGRHWMAHFHAAAIVCEKPYLIQHMPPLKRRAWDWITEEVAAFDGDALLSSERFAGALDDQADQALRRLEEVAGEVHVLVTARDLARQLPSSWQQHVRSGGDLTLDEWWRGLGDDSSRFWRSQDLVGLLTRWSQGLPADRAHLVVHARPGAPRHLLWERVCEVLGVEPGLVQPVARVNPSLGAAHVELLRRVNSTLPPERNPAAVGAFTKGFFAGQMIIAAGPSPPFVLPAEVHDWAVRRSRVMVDELRTRGYDVVGDLAYLLPDSEARPGVLPQEVSEADLLELAVPALGRSLMQQKKFLDELRTLRRAARTSAGADAGATSSRPGGARWLRRARRVVRVAGGRGSSAAGRPS
jgi:hypothetical protein